MALAFWMWHGWDALVAVGTLALAGTTGLLAGLTLKATKLSGREIALEQRRLEAEQRPIVLPRSAAVAPAHGGYDLAVVNAGPGAALNVTGWIKATAGDLDTSIALPKCHLEPGGDNSFRFDPLALGPLHDLAGELVCEGLAGDMWRTEFGIHFGDPVGPRNHQPAELTVLAPYLYEVRK